MTHIDWNTVPLGQEPDHIIAKKLNCHVRVVGDQRRKRDIIAMVKEAPDFKPGMVATPEQRAKYFEQWRKFPRNFAQLCRQCEEDFNLDKRRNASKVAHIVRRKTDCGIYCLSHYAALPLCASCGKSFAYRQGGLCERCSGELSLRICAEGREVEDWREDEVNQPTR